MQEKSQFSNKSQENRQQKSNKYSYVPLQKRKRLIQMVINDGVSIYRACRDLDIKNSIAKVIIRRYKSEGTMYISKSERQVPKPTKKLNKISRVTKITKTDQNIKNEEFADLQNRVDSWDCRIDNLYQLNDLQDYWPQVLLQEKLKDDLSYLLISQSNIIFNEINCRALNLSLEDYDLKNVSFINDPIQIFPYLPYGFQIS